MSKETIGEVTMEPSGEKLSFVFEFPAGTVDAASLVPEDPETERRSAEADLLGASFDVAQMAGVPQEDAYAAGMRRLQSSQGLGIKREDPYAAGMRELQGQKARKSIKNIEPFTDPEVDPDTENTSEEEAPPYYGGVVIEKRGSANGYIPRDRQTPADRAMIDAERVARYGLLPREPKRR
jgi:hypothetical protein